MRRPFERNNRALFVLLLSVASCGVLALSSLPSALALQESHGVVRAPSSQPSPDPIATGTQGCGSSAGRIHYYLAPASLSGCPVGFASMGPVTYHGGPVMHNPTNYLIFWLPSGSNFDGLPMDLLSPTATNANYEMLIERYFQDVGNTAFYNILQQYTDSTGAPGSSSTYGGAWIDTSSYTGGRGSYSKPLNDTDILNEAIKAIDTNHWSTNHGNSEFFVFTGYAVFSCGAPNSCFAQTGGFCAYHSYSPVMENGSPSTLVYANMPDDGYPGCDLTSYGGGTGSNTDYFADSEINAVSHEHFESVSDPQGNAWFYGTQEIADECVNHYGTIIKGYNVALHKDNYTVQQEWSNLNAGCYLPPIAPVLVPIALSYSVHGGGTGFAPPTISYSSYGQVSSAALNSTQTTLNIDLGTVWSVNNPLIGSSSTERWQTNQVTSGTAISAQTLAFNYYHQFSVFYGYSVIAGGTGYSVPTAAYSQFGIPSSIVAGNAVWADASSTWFYPTVLQGSGLYERWFAQAVSGQVTSSAKVSPAYYHEYLVTTSYSVVGGGSPAAPTLSGTSAGANLNVTISATAPSYYLDAGTQYALSSLLPGSTSSERWETVNASPGIVTSPLNLSPVYYHQYSVGTTYSIRGGGSPNPPTLSYVSFATPETQPLSLSGGSPAWADSGSSYSIPTILQPSSLSERWEAVGSLGGSVTGPQNSVPVYYHQFLVGMGYQVAGGGTPAPPSVSYTLFGDSVNAAVGGATSSIWADAGPYSLTNPLGGSTRNERWFGASATASIAVPGNILVVYDHQFLLSVNGGNVQSQWFNVGDTANLTPSGVFGRDATSGQRITSYSIDGGAQVAVPPTSGPVGISISMNAPHSLNFAAVRQFRVTLDSNASAGFASITQPTVSGDKYWYDSGSVIDLILNGTWGRSGGMGTRLASFGVNGVSSTVATSGRVAVLNQFVISSPVQITSRTATQFFLDTSAGSLNSMTSPQIAGDKGWYDSGTAVTMSYNYVWNPVANQARSNALSYSLDGGQETVLPRAGTGTFSMTVQMDKPHRVGVRTVTQYRLSVSGGSNVALSVKSQTGDEFFDAGSTVAATTPYVWGLVPNDSRQSLVGYSLDGTVTSIPRSEKGDFTSPSIVLDAPHALVFNSAAQYFVAFKFTDAAGARSVVPVAMRIQTQNGEPQDVPNFQTWLDNGTSFSVGYLGWEGVDVKPLGATSYSISHAIAPTIAARIYDAKMEVSDYLGLAIQGARVDVTLTNGTVISRTTPADGTVSIPSIPLGTFQARVTYLGTSTQITGDAATQSPTVVKSALSYPTIAVVGGSVGALALLTLLLWIRKHKTAPH